MYFLSFSLLHTFGFSSLFLWPTCFSGTKFLSQQSFKLGSKTHARQSPFTPAVQRAMQWSNPYHNVCHLYFLGWICFNSDEMCFWNLDWDLCSAWNIPSRQIKEAHITSSIENVEWITKFEMWLKDLCVSQISQLSLFFNNGWNMLTDRQTHWTCHSFS